MSANKIIWSPLIEFGSTLYRFQTAHGVGMMIVVETLWCNPHQKTCLKFRFGELRRNEQDLQQLDFNIIHTIPAVF